MRQRPFSRRSQGFTLIEMLITVVVVGVLASLTSLALIPTIQRNQLNAATDQLAQALVRAQQQAETRSRSYIFQFDTVSTAGIPTTPVRYRFYDTALTVAQIAAEPWQNLPTGVYFGTAATFGANPEAQTLFPVDTLGPQYRSLTFDETGAANVTGRITLSLNRNPGDITSVARISIPILLGGIDQDCLVTQTGPNSKPVQIGQVGRC
ncbi:prepilin-type N-terminal cleavage/methylation domain-containing protein [Anthocerotibacter panamensis]|uniref:prepilin-type N-terminal cleavage/methylation domain-containing protein n=1 Tax=Anthocerotibacter panamensis TaxID=2857077 RepID=UPI001C4042E2|nr:prepilin-type N-terminal cleavage/methylation domain-containing protein [Anthocerotibacter panamensis]